ncbi:DUF3662 and FHA domain-containing protein [Brevibacterium jeotgali]|uniref:FHA domain-containing protein n=1 Tax=Brevibacterium jeotgali TaxID=1262550 RepID=A0A2H1L4R8_9MICO|nr:DUF3662 and FHA domain-containing protein [Brevibacterium jeotgali]TWC01535.1 type III secretion system (T3SS) inner membrane Yop/YscD-like protein [Brevibacterium jeotgali]SMY11859.1 FHA domain-containing protein [Brevibacterium jeotgali]
MGVLDRFERGIDRVVNGAFARAFRSQVEPVELASALRREADNRAAVVSRGRTLTANSYAVELSSGDLDRLGPVSSELRQDLRQVVGDHAIEQGYSFVGPVAVTFEVADDLDTGMYRVRATTRRPDGSPAAQPANRGGYDPPSRSNPVVPEQYEAQSGPVSAPQNQVSQRPPAAAPAPNVAPAPEAPGSRRRGAPADASDDPPARAAFTPTVSVQGQVHRLPQGTTVFGRSANSADIVIDDPGMSRRHFEITVSGDQAVATDLGSTNGTHMSGRPIGSVSLSEGSVLTAGDTPVTYSEAGRFSE